MGWRERFENGKIRLLADASICLENRDLFRQFFDFEEYKLKRQNSLRELDDGCYKTLYGYILRFRNVNRWFGNKPWADLNKEDIKRVYDDLEDGRIKNRHGLPYEDRSSYYNKVFKSKPFRLAGKSELAKDVIEFSTQQREEVRFTTEEAFTLLVSVLSQPRHLLLFWLAWDIGENIGALLQLTKADFQRQISRVTNDPEYLVNLPKRKIKRSRKSRSEPTLYLETVRYADIVLRDLDEHDRIFPFGHRQALKLMTSAVAKTGAKCMPNDDPVRWKDLRSGMACHLLRNGWTCDEVDARLGHTPGSKALGRYLNHLALDRDRPKKKLYDSKMEGVQSELEESKIKEKLAHERLRHQDEENQTLKAELGRTQSDLRALRELVESIAGSLNLPIPLTPG